MGFQAERVLFFSALPWGRGRAWQSPPLPAVPGPHLGDGAWSRGCFRSAFATVPKPGAGRGWADAPGGLRAARLTSASGAAGFRFRRAAGAMPLHRVPVHLWPRLRLRRGLLSRLPAAFLRALEERRAPAPVHYRPRRPGFGAGAGAGAGARPERAEDVPIPLYFPAEAQKGLWGGEGWILGYRYVGDDKLSKRVKKIWKPQLFERELYSEILDKKFTVTVTMRTLDLIDEAYGFDFYILKTPKEDLCSKFGMDLKRGMLLRLARQDPQLHPEDPERRAAVYAKYKDFVIPEAEAEWVGLTLEEAVEKQRLLEEKDPVPLFKVYVEELVEQLRQQALSEPAVVQRKASAA